jgi:ligand-binding sensor domain-containing protein
MSIFRRWRLLMIAVLAAWPAGCRAPVGGGAPGAGGAARPSAGFAVSRYAESVPIAAIAFRAPYLWAGTEHGLRRWNVLTEESQWIGPAVGLLGHNVSALGIDGAGAVWVATEAGIGRIAPQGAQLRYEPQGALAGITLLAPTRSDGGAWAGGPGGLFHLDGRSWTIFDFLRDVPVTSLEVDEDGLSVWVGTQDRGLFHVDQRGGQPILQPADRGDFDRIVGTALSHGEVRVVGARAGEGGRITFLTRDGPQVYRTQPGARIRFVRLLGSGGEPALVAGAPGAERIYALRRLPRGEAPPEGGFRLVSAGDPAGDRYAAVPAALIPPPGVTVVAAGAAAGDLWFGSEAMGVARAEAKRPRYWPGAELTGDADRLSVACTARDHCYVVAGGDHAWLFDGGHFRAARVGEPADGRALAVVTADRAGAQAGAVFGVSSEPKLAGLVLTRLTSAGAGAASATAPGAPAAVDQWQPLLSVPLPIPPGSPTISFAAFAPDGNLWLGLGVLGPDGQEQGRGAVEIALGTGKVIHHGAAQAVTPDPESLPLPYDLTGILFDGPATWFSSRSGMSRWQESELRRWGENDHMTSEVCYGVAKGLDGSVWAATSAGVGRFADKRWRFVDADDPASVATRALTRDAAGRIWLATSKGLRVLTAAGVTPTRLDPGETVVDDDSLDTTLDRYGRIWALGDSSLSLVQPDAAR